MSILSQAVKIADKVTKSLKMQSEVTHYSFAGDGGNGAPTYKPTNGTKRFAIVDEKQRQVRSFSGTLVPSNATVLFVGKVAVKPNDQIKLADGTWGEVVGEGGFIDKESKVYTEVYLG